MKANILILGSDNLSKEAVKALQDSGSKDIKSVKHITQMPAMADCIAGDITHLILFSYRILSAEEIRLADGVVELLNIHPSPLPLYAGADPIGAQILEGIITSVCTLQTVEEKVDTGRILATAPYYVNSVNIQSAVGTAGAVAVLAHLEGQEPTRTKKVTKDIFQIPHGITFRNMRRLQRFAYYHGEALRVGEFKVWLGYEPYNLRGSTSESTKVELGYKDGSIYLSTGTFRAFKVEALQAPSKSKVSAKDALNALANTNTFNLKNWESYYVAEL